MSFFTDPTVTLPIIFAGLMGFSILVYVILDGFDLGVGALMPLATDTEKDRMIASIGPFWDANETWLVMAIGLLLVAFPAAHGAILTALYLPVAVMLIGLILRGVAFEFRGKSSPAGKHQWNIAFVVGSLMASLSQGFMLGLYIMGLEYTPATTAFALLTGVCLTIAYAFIGATWLILKTEGVLQLKAIAWARRGLWGVVVGLGCVSITTPLVSARIFDKWFSLPEFAFLLPLPLMSLGLVGVLWLSLRHLPDDKDTWSWIPFMTTAVLFALGFVGMAYSFYPYVVPEKLTIYETASAPESLIIILVGTCIVVPIIMAYTALAYFIFRGKATDLSYE
jgi:cytochrome d ubiquinol oxidase subunit II